MSRYKPVAAPRWLRALALLGLALAGAGPAQALGPKPLEPQTVMTGIGRTATAAEISAWDIDVRPDFKGLPAGQGSVHQGEVLWEARCASCHGTFGEASHVFTPIAGGVVAQDLKTGRVAGLLPGANQPNRTTVMKLSTLSTLWDYINRAMPWNAPKTLTADEVYAATAYILYLGDVVPADFTLSDRNMREVQARLPNRHGMTTAHALWPGKELGGTARPDVQGSACMRNCTTEVVIKSMLPEHARNAHGNLADQSRLVGASRGADTGKSSIAENAKPNTAPAQAQRAQAAPEKGAPAGQPAGADGAGAAPAAASSMVVMKPPPQSQACAACHSMDGKLLGPSFKDIASKYKDRADAVNYLSGKIRAGGQGVWGAMAMPAQALSPAESLQLAEWLMQSPLAAASK